MDRVGFEVRIDKPCRRRHRGFSILWWIELVLRDQGAQRCLCAAQRFSILWWIELVLRDEIRGKALLAFEFQYPLVDRVGFEGAGAAGSASIAQAGFSILWWIELVLRVAHRTPLTSLSCWFQYPLVDRVGFEGPCAALPRQSLRCFSILWWIELVLRLLMEHVASVYQARFSILWWIELVLRAGARSAVQPPASRFSILWWIELVLRAGRAVAGAG